MPESLINKTRADNARHALESYLYFVYPLESDPELSGNETEAVSDFLTDLMHFCRQNDLDFDDLQYRAWRHFERDVHEEERALPCSN